MHDFGGTSVRGSICLVPQSVVAPCPMDPRPDECSDVLELNSRIVAAVPPTISLSCSETSWTSHNFRV